MLRRTLSFECQITILKTIQQTVLI
jgi:hypothetical protein